jgi:ACS family hexuronate transporter-like MFS transporter
VFWLGARRRAAVERLAVSLRVLTRANAWTVAVVATLTMTVSYIDRSTLAVLAPSVTKALDIGEAEYGWLTSAFAIAYLFATPISGWWIDRIGARRGLVGSILAWTTVAAMHALVPGFVTLFILRTALGFAEGPSFPGAAQTVQRILPPEERSRGFGLLFTGSSIGGMIVPPLAAALYDAGGWRVAFLGTSMAGLLWIPLWLYVTGKPAAREKLDAYTDAARAQRMSFGQVLRDRDMIRALASILAVAPVFALGLSWGAKYLARTFDVAQEDVGHYLWMPPLLFDAAAILAGDLASRQVRAPGAPPRFLYGAGLVLTLALALLPIAATPWQSMAFIGVAMAGGGVIYTLTLADVLSRVPPGAVSFAGGTVACAQSVAQIFANPLIGASVDSTHSYDTAAIVLAVWVLPGCLLWLLLKPRPVESTSATSAA